MAELKWKMGQRTELININWHWHLLKGVHGLRVVGNEHKTVVAGSSTVGQQVVEHSHFARHPRVNGLFAVCCEAGGGKKVHARGANQILGIEL